MKGKITIMKSRAELTDEEIQQHMNFDKLLLDREKLMTRHKNFRILRNSAIGLAGIALMITLGLFMIQRPSSNNDFASNKSNTSNKENHTPQLPGDSISRNNEKQALKKAPLNNEEKITKKRTAVVENTNRNSDEGVNKNKIPGEAVYIQAEPVNGYPDLYEYFDRELIYPPLAIKDSIQGVVTVIFSINLKGKPDNIQMENSLGKLFDEEVLRIIGKMPLWNPASYNGKPVNSKVSVPLTFQLNKLNIKD